MNAPAPPTDGSQRSEDREPRRPDRGAGNPAPPPPLRDDRGPNGSSPITRRRLAIAGWLLYGLSWITPSLDGRQFGAVAFVESVRFGWNLLSTDNIVLGLCVLAGWLANFSILLRLPGWLRMAASIAPWLAFAVVLLKLPVRPSLPGRAMFFLYFYPWAMGIALIHAARKPAPTGALQ